MPGKLRCLLLCEDAEQEWLFRPILKRLFHRVYVEPRRPNGGFTFVLARLVDVAKYVRQRHQEAVGLLVAIDGDQAGFQRRLDAIQEVLRSSGLDSKRFDRIAVCIPARNVETWELWLYGVRDLDEQTDYKDRFHREVKPRVHHSQLIDAWFAPLSDDQREQEAARLPALAHGRAEFKRLQKLT